MFEQMQRQWDEMMRRARNRSRDRAMHALNCVLRQNAGGEASTTVVSMSHDGVTCTRTTSIVSQGQGKAPKVTSSASGQCDGPASNPSGSAHPA